MWVSINEYCQIENISRQAVYKRIKKEYVKTKKAKNGRTLIYVTKSNADDAIKEIPEENQSTSIQSSDIEMMLQSLKDAHLRELERMHDIIKMKDQQIQELLLENGHLKDTINDNPKTRKKFLGGLLKR